MKGVQLKKKKKKKKKEETFPDHSFMGGSTRLFDLN